MPSWKRRNRQVYEEVTARKTKDEQIEEINCKVLGMSRALERFMEQKDNWKQITNRIAECEIGLERLKHMFRNGANVVDRKEEIIREMKKELEMNA